MPITVVIADQQGACRTMCRRILGSEKGIRVVAEAQNAMEAMESATKYTPDILILDINLATANGLSLLPRIMQNAPSTRTILLTRRTSEARILDALCCGARGYIAQ